jgi:hypothetical protein
MLTANTTLETHQPYKDTPDTIPLKRTHRHDTRHLYHNTATPTHPAAICLPLLRMHPPCAGHLPSGTTVTPIQTALLQGNPCERCTSCAQAHYRSWPGRHRTTSHRVASRLVAGKQRVCLYPSNTTRQPNSATYSTHGWWLDVKLSL